MTRGVKVDAETAAELKRLRELEKQYKVLKEEHELLKKPSAALFIWCFTLLTVI